MAKKNDNAAPATQGQIAPGEEAIHPLDVPYTGFRPGDHIGYPLNASFQIGAEFGRY